MFLCYFIKRKTFQNVRKKNCSDISLSPHSLCICVWIFGNFSNKLLNLAFCLNVVISLSVQLTDWSHIEGDGWWWVRVADIASHSAWYKTQRHENHIEIGDHCCDSNSKWNWTLLSEKCRISWKFDFDFCCCCWNFSRKWISFSVYSIQNELAFWMGQYIVSWKAYVLNFKETSNVFGIYLTFIPNWPEKNNNNNCVFVNQHEF